MLQNSPNQSQAVELGLRPNTAYTISKVMKVRFDDDRGSVFLIRIRHPNGKDKEWKGAWSDG